MFYLKRNLTLIFWLMLNTLLSPAEGQNRAMGRVDRAMWQAYIDQTPGAYSFESQYVGDLNKDGLRDVIVVAINDTTTDYGYSRRVLLLLRQRGKGYKVAATNDQVIDCTRCGGVLGDPHEGVDISGSYSSFYSRYGANQRTAQIITFRYSPGTRDWLLHKISLLDYVSATARIAPLKTKTARHFGRVRFQNFTTDLIYGK